jgi:hypothetical protein
MYDEAQTKMKRTNEYLIKWWQFSLSPFFQAFALVAPCNVCHHHTTIAVMCNVQIVQNVLLWASVGINFKLGEQNRA